MVGFQPRNGSLRVAVILGGQSAEREISMKTGETVVSQLRKRHSVRPVVILGDGRWIVSPHTIGPDPSDGRPTALRAEGWSEGQGKPLVDAVGDLIRLGVDAVFNALHGPLGEDGTIQGLLRLVDIPFTGPDVGAAAVTIDKRWTKQVIMTAGLTTPKFFTIPASVWIEGGSAWRGQIEENFETLPFPWIVKPNRLGSSVGVGKFESPEQVLREGSELVRAWPRLAHADRVLVEQVVFGRELTCGVLEVGGAPRALPPVEIVPPEGSFFDYHAKYVPGASREICPAELSAQQTARIQETALRVHALLDCAPLSRTDMFLTEQDEIQVLEVNTLPGMTATSLIPLSASKAGIALEDLLDALVQFAIQRARALAGTAEVGAPG